MAYSVAHVGYIDNSLVLSWVQRSVGLIALLAQGWLLGLPKIFELIGLTAILSNGGMDYRSDEVFNDSHGQWDALQTQLNHVPLFKVKIKFISLAVFDDRPSRGSQTLDADSAELHHRTDAFIQDIFRRELSGDATVITIAHRLEMIMDADRVVEDGNPQDLLKMQHDHLHALVGDSPNKEELFATIH
ncbi:hypothetical protein WG66_015615 [Moniliophthora roreri]|nr:hypothetical protein WG66_015615 [Moniliophthora roreri]